MTNAVTNGQPIISIRGLRKTYHAGEVDVHALRGVDLDVQPGEFVSVVGPSGSGKSTLFHIVGGLTPPTSGTIHIGGRDLLGMSDAERTELRKTSVGFVFQKYNLLPTLTADLNKLGKSSCVVSAQRFIAKTVDNHGYIEVACADGGRGYIIEYTSQPLAPDQAIPCVSAKQIEGGCTLPTNKG